MAAVPRTVSYQSVDVVERTGLTDRWARNVDAHEIEEMEKLIKSRSEVDVPDDVEAGFSWRTLWAFTGPGLLMSIAYVDPGNLESDLQSGAYTGNQLIGILFYSTLIGLLQQIMAARLGVVTGRNLAELCRLEYPRKVSRILWVMTEVAIVGSDIQEVIGSAIAFNILFNWPLWVGCLVTGVDTFSFLALHALGIRKLEAFFAVLIGTMAACFFYDFSMTRSSVNDLGAGMVNPIQEYAVVQAVGVVGAVIMPHNIYLHSALVQSRAVDTSDERSVRQANKYFAIEAALALLLSFLINAAVVGVFASGFFLEACANNDFHDGPTACVPDSGAVKNNPTFIPCDNGHGPGHCQSIGLTGAASALEGMLGSAAKYVWALGLLAAGQSATMTGTYAGQFVMEGFLRLRVSAWKRVGITRALALTPAVLVALASQSSPTTSDTMGEWLNILQSVQLPFALIPVLHFTRDTRIMGQFANGDKMHLLLWAITALVVGINLFLVVDFLNDSNNETTQTTWFRTLVYLGGVGYFFLLGTLLKEEIMSGVASVKRFFGREQCGVWPEDSLEGGEDDEERTWLFSKKKAVSISL